MARPEIQGSLKFNNVPQERKPLLQRDLRIEKWSTSTAGQFSAKVV